MRIDEIINRPDQLIYHFTNGENLRQILEQNAINAGASTHEVGNYKKDIDENGKPIFTLVNKRIIKGISFTRDRNLDLLKTYAASGHKPYRLGLNYSLLRMNHKIIPVRDNNYFQIHKGTHLYNRVLSSYNYGETRTDSNEAEEFLVGDIKDLTKYWSELAVDLIKMEQVDSHFYDSTDQDQNTQFYVDMVKGTFGKNYGRVNDPVYLPKSVKFVEINYDMPHPNTDNVIQHKRRDPPDPRTKKLNDPHYTGAIGGSFDKGLSGSTLNFKL